MDQQKAGDETQTAVIAGVKLEEVRLKDNEDIAKAAAALAARTGFIIADLPADDLLKAADALRDRGTLLLNAGAIDDRLREQDCRANVIHVAPTRSMLAIEMPK